jgi:glutamyl-Q tRNA(Asp) synthetase
VGINTYRGRFAPSPTGPLHAGSLVAALASWLDARAHKGQWLVRIEDIDTPRCQPGAGELILKQLADCGLIPDEKPVWQSKRIGIYQDALDRLITGGLAYPCGCTRQDIALALAARGQTRDRHGEMVYPGTCRNGLAGKEARSWRFSSDFQDLKNTTEQQGRSAVATYLVAHTTIHWTDRRLGEQMQDVSLEVGDFILKRADDLWAYQLAVVVDDAAQGITHVVRGEDLVNNTARQILLQRALGLQTPQYLHTPLVLAADGEKLSKQHGARMLDTTQPTQLLQAAGQALGINIQATYEPGKSDWLQTAIGQWRSRTALARGNP